MAPAPDPDANADTLRETQKRIREERRHLDTDYATMLEEQFEQAGFRRCSACGAVALGLLKDTDDKRKNEFAMWVLENCLGDRGAALGVLTSDLRKRYASVLPPRVARVVFDCSCDRKDDSSASFGKSCSWYNDAFNRWKGSVKVDIDLAERCKKRKKELTKIMRSITNCETVDRVIEYATALIDGAEGSDEETA
jgi:hypothetical protein